MSVPNEPIVPPPPLPIDIPPGDPDRIPADEPPRDPEPDEPLNPMICQATRHPTWTPALPRRPPTAGAIPTRQFTARS